MDDTNNNLSKVELNKESAEKYFGLLMKAFRNLYNQQNWEVRVDSCREVIDYSTQVLASKHILIIQNLWIFLLILIVVKDAMIMASI